MEEFRLECACHQRSHALVMSKDDGDLYIEFQLSQYLGFWARLVAAIKYVVQPQSTVLWDEVVVSDDKVQQLKQFLETK